MFDVFTEEIEVQIKEGIANLYWYKDDLRKALIRSGVTPEVANNIYAMRESNGQRLTKRQQMDVLYNKLRGGDFNRRLEISRNFVRILVEHKNFRPQDKKHRIERAERCALKLKEIIREQEKQRRQNAPIKKKNVKKHEESYSYKLQIIQDNFQQYSKLKAQERGYALEKLFQELMLASGIQVQQPFKIKGEQIDGGIKYDAHYYLIELKWTEKRIGPGEIGSFYYKVDGKLEQRGIIISMGGYTEGVIESLPRGKEIKVILLDGVHLSNVIFGLYTFQELLEHSISHASFYSNLYCPHKITT